MTRTLRTLTASLVDYAGLFPPTTLDMAPSVENYARYLRMPEAEMLGRFICPVSRLKELSSHGAMLMPGTFATSGYREMADDIPAWRISAIIDADLGDCLSEIDAFNEHHSTEAQGLAQVDAIEMRVGEPGDIDDALDEIPEDIYPAFEVPQKLIMAGDPRGYIAAMSGAGCSAKIRCGGVTPDLIPDSGAIARFIIACAQGGVPFKATAGLHHPVRGEQNLTYEENPARGVMHGFLNVFMAAAMIRIHRINEDQAAEILEDTDAGSFTFTDEDARWKDKGVGLIDLSRVRETFALSYGSCSFEEPVADLRALSLV